MVCKMRGRCFSKLVESEVRRRPITGYILSHILIAHLCPSTTRRGEQYRVNITPSTKNARHTRNIKWLSISTCLVAASGGDVLARFNGPEKIPVGAGSFTALLLPLW